MNNIENTGGGEQENPQEALGRRSGPRIYVASLSDYNNGELLGAWIDADQEPVELHAAIEQMLATSREPIAEEWAIHDYEGFGSMRLSEYESMATISRLALGIAEHGPAFAALAEIVGSDHEEALRRFEDHYLGRFESMEAFARNLADDLGWEDELDKLPEGVRPYVDIDYEMLGRDLGTELWEVDAPEGGIYVFDTRL